MVQESVFRYCDPLRQTQALSIASACVLQAFQLIQTRPDAFSEEVLIRHAGMLTRRYSELKDPPVINALSKLQEHIHQITR
jgi:hypothetical protein